MPAPVTPSSAIGQAWDRYRSMVVPVAASAEQIKATRWAFYAGAEAFLDELAKLSAGPNWDTDAAEIQAGAERLEALRLEVEQFAAEVAKLVAR